MTDGAVHLIGTITDAEDHYGTCEVRIEWEDALGIGWIWLPIPDVVEDPREIPSYVGRRVNVTVSMMDEDGLG